MIDTFQDVTIRTLRGGAELQFVELPADFAGMELERIVATQRQGVDAAVRGEVGESGTTAAVMQAAVRDAVNEASADLGQEIFRAVSRDDRAREDLTLQQHTQRALGQERTSRASVSGAGEWPIEADRSERSGRSGFLPFDVSLQNLGRRDVVAPGASEPMGGFIAEPAVRQPWPDFAPDAASFRPATDFNEDRWTGTQQALEREINAAAEHIAEQADTMTAILESLSSTLIPAVLQAQERLEAQERRVRAETDRLQAARAAVQAQAKD